MEEVGFVSVERMACYSCLVPVVERGQHEHRNGSDPHSVLAQSGGSQRICNMSERSPCATARERNPSIPGAMASRIDADTTVDGPMVI